MHLTTRNVNTAFRTLVDAIANGGGYFPTTNDPCPVVRRNSRNGPVLMIDEPVMITYTHPRERVLFNRARDTSPFLNLYEPLWMLAGRNDVAPLAYYAANMANYSDDGQTLNGAYGYRWRHGWNNAMWADGRGKELANTDQLRILINHLKADPTSRRAVLQMWNVEDDLLKIGANPDKSGNFYNPDLKFPPSKDVCCNLSVMFSIREDRTDDGRLIERQIMTDAETIDSAGLPMPMFKTVQQRFLDMTVTNRSNDMIWGTLSGDYTTFSFLQEYMAAQIGVEVGRYTQMSNNLHVYESNWKPEEWLRSSKSDMLEFGYDSYNWNLAPLIKDPAVFDEELPRFVETYSGENPERKTIYNYKEPFFIDVASPMMDAFYAHKRRQYAAATDYCSQIKADDWRIAVTNWITKREENYERRDKTAV